MVFLPHQLLHLVTILLLVRKHELAIHYAKFSLGCHGLEINGAVCAAHLTPLEVAWLSFGAKCCFNFVRSEHTKAHCVVFASDGAHIGQLRGA